MKHEIRCNSGTAARLAMAHSHQYSFWHAHEHVHTDPTKGASEWKVTYIDDDYRFKHGTGHSHVYAQTHEHGLKSSLTPHSHKAKQYHPETDEENEAHHHAPIDHKPLDYDTAEHHPECKFPYYGGGLKGCIDRCAKSRE